MTNGGLLRHFFFVIENNKLFVLRYPRNISKAFVCFNVNFSIVLTNNKLQLCKSTVMVESDLLHFGE